MSFYPLFDILDNSGFVNLPNFSPNNWEKTQIGSKLVHAISANESLWESRSAGSIQQDTFRRFLTSDFAKINCTEHEDGFVSDVVLLHLGGQEDLTGNFKELPQSLLSQTHWPEWRATIGFENAISKVSYQGEINPFPPVASLLTFHPFIQFESVNNYFVFLNIEKSPKYRWTEIEIYLSGSAKKIGTHKIRNNSANIIPLDKYGFLPQDLPVFISKNMAGIPFGYGVDINSGMLSLEHTHPPASFTLHGNRISSQKSIKMNWAKFLNCH
jgi:hypothetical protein